MGRRRRVNRQAPNVSDIGQVAEELETLDEFAARVGSPVNTESDDGPAALGQIAELPFVPRA